MPRWFLSKRAIDLSEIMDDPDCDPDLLINTYAWFARLNPLLGRWKSVYRTLIRPILRPERATRILDIGCGAGDVLRLIRHLASQDGFDLELMGIDPDERAIICAREMPSNTGISFDPVHSSELVTRGDQFDIVISNHVLHHLSPGELLTLAHDSALLAGDLVIHNDIKRDDLAWLFFWPVGLVCRNSFILTDGLRSIRRAWHPKELRRLLPNRWTVETRTPFRLLLIHPTDE